MNEKIQNWRAVAVSEHNKQHLIYIAGSYELIKKQYETAFYDVLTDEEQASVNHIKLERWQGLPDKGKWVQQDSLNVPNLIAKKLQTY